MRTLVIVPSAPLVTWEEAATHLKLDDDEHRGEVEAMIAAAGAHIDGPEGWLGRSIGLQTLETYLPSFGCVSIGLPYPPAVDVTEIGYIDSAGAAQTLDASAYQLRGQLLSPSWGSSWPAAAWQGAGGETVRVRYRAGYATLPAPIRAAILLMVGDLYRFRETATQGGEVHQIPMSTTVAALLGPFRVFG